MDFTVQARVPTANGAKYAAQPGKHWGHSLSVAQEGEAWSITFPHDTRGANWLGDAVVTLQPDGDFLICRIAANCAEQRDGMKGRTACRSICLP